MFKKHKWLSLIFLIVILLALTMIVLSLIPGKQPGRSVLAELFGLRAPSVSVSELNFDVGRNRNFAHANGSVACVGTLGLQVLGPDGRETLRETTRFTSPVIAENSGHFLAYDIGASSVRVFTAQSILSSVETEAPVISASINKNGWYCIALQEQSGGYRGTVYVYNNKGRPVYKVSLGSGYVQTAALCDDNSTLAILNIADTGTRITLYKGIDDDKDYADEIIELGEKVFFDIEYLTSTRILAVGAESVLVADFSSDVSIQTLYAYEENKLGGYTSTDKFIALHLYDYNIGYAGQIISLDFNGNMLGQAETPTEVISMSSFDNTLMLLSSEGIRFYDKQIDSFIVADSEMTVTAGKLIALREDMALVASDLSAIVVRSEG